MTRMERVLEGSIGLLVGRVVVPVTSTIPILVRTGILLAAFATVWLAFLAAMVGAPGTLDEVSRAIGAWPFVMQLLAWVLLLPVMAGLWVWDTDWPLVVRAGLLVALAAWNLLVMIPHPEQPAPATAR
jgi:hypothetical protein